MPKRRAGATPVERFADRIALTDSGCIEWFAGVAGAGYGVFFSGRTSDNRTGLTYAHRWSYEHHVGPIPEGLQIDHLCRNTKCVRADHLEPVTAQENLARSSGLSAQNSAKTHCPAGHVYAGANLYITSRGERQCRKCKTQTMARLRARKAA